MANQYRMDKAPGPQVAVEQPQPTAKDNTLRNFVWGAAGFILAALALIAALAR